MGAVNLGIATAYGYAKSKGYTGTEEEFTQLMYDLTIVVPEAEEAADAAEAAASTASDAAYEANQAKETAIAAATTANTAAAKIDNMTVEAEAATGTTPSAVISEVSGHKNILFKLVPGEKGDIGDTPALSVGTVATGEPGSDAAVTISGTTAAPVLNFTIPQGADGDATVDDDATIGDTEHVWSADKTKKELDKKANDFAPVIHNDFPEDLKVLENCAEGMGMGFEIPIAPVQDLHGYASPWVGGAGKNICPYMTKENQDQGIVTTLNDDGTVVVNGTTNNGARYYALSSAFEVQAGVSYILSGCPEGGSLSSYRFDIRSATDVGLDTELGNYFDYGSGVTFTPSTTHSIRISVRLAANVTVSNLKFYPMVRISSASAEYAPYTNICPISGFTGVDITRTGRNLLKNDLVTTTRNNVKFTKNDDGTVAVSGTASANTSVDILGSSANPYKGFLTGSYIISKGNTNNNVRLSINMYNGTTWIKQTVAGASDNVEFEINYDGYDGVVVSLYVPNSANVNETVMPMIRYARETDATYEPHKGNVYSITWESAGTVYGGTVTINEDGSGKIVADMASKTVTSEADLPAFVSDGTNGSYAQIASDAKINDAVAMCICSMCEGISFNNRVSESYKGKDRCYVDNTGKVTIRASNAVSISTKAEMVAEFNNAQIVYELASPVEYPLTPQQITSLFGTNVLWNSIGTFSVSYHIDPKIYVDDTAGMAGSISKTDSTEASVKTFSDGADNLPMEVSVAINPVQDTHGFDPFPAGASKNKLPTMAEGFTAGNIVVTINDDGSVRLNGTNGTGAKAPALSSAMTVVAGTEYILSGCPTGGGTNTYRIDIRTTSGESLDTELDTVFDTGSGATFTPTTTHEVRFGIRVASQVQLDKVFYPMLRLSSESDASYVPYENICPISGWDSVQITRTGKELIHDATLTDGYYIASNGTITQSDGFNYTSLIPVSVGDNLTMHGEKTTTGSSQAKRIHGYDSNGTWVQQIDYVLQDARTTGVYDKDFTIPSGIASIRLSFPTGEKDFYVCTKDTDAVYPISLPTTAYGGTLTVNKDGTGTLITDVAGINVSDVDTINAYGSGTSKYYYFTVPGIKRASSSSEVPEKLISNMYSAISGSRATGSEDVKGIAISSNNDYLIIKDTSVADSAELKARGIFIVYPLSSSSTINLTAEQIRSLNGKNNIFADSGNILSVNCNIQQKVYIDESSDYAMKMGGSVDVNSGIFEYSKVLPDGADSLPMEVETSIVASQDLHGYSGPWDGGAGKNILPMTISGLKSVNTTGTWSGNAYTNSGVTFTVNTDNDDNVIGISTSGTASANAFFYIHSGLFSFLVNGTSYVLNGCPSGGASGSSGTYELQLRQGVSNFSDDIGNGTTVSFNSSIDSSSSMVRIVIYSGTDSTGKNFYPMIRLSTVTDATYAPYSNICPVVGYDSIDITVTGKNMIDPDEIDSGLYVNGSGMEVTNADMCTTDFIPVITNASYTFSGVGHNTSIVHRYIHGYYANKSWKEAIYDIGSVSDGASYSRTITIPINCAYVRMTYALADTNNQFEKGTSASTYEPFGKVYSLNTPQTVYGGRLTVNKDGSGTLYITHNRRKISDLTWNRSENSGTFYSNEVSDFPNITSTGNSGRSSLYSVYVESNNTFKTRDFGMEISNLGFGSTRCLLIRDARFDNVTDLVNAVGDGEVVYSRIEPITMDIPAEQIMSLLGTNTIYSNSGMIRYANYRADQRLYIDQKFDGINLSAKADKANPVFTGSVNMGRNGSMSGTNVTALGYAVSVTANYAHAEGYSTQSSGEASHVEGKESIVRGIASHAEGYKSEAKNDYSHAEGNSTKAYGTNSHSEGNSTRADADNSHAEGDTTSAYGTASHAEGYHTWAQGANSHVYGMWNVINSYPAYWTQWVKNTNYVVGDKVYIGKTIQEGGMLRLVYEGYVCNTNHTSGNTFSGDESKWDSRNGLIDFVEIVGNGTTTNSRSNARALDWEGNERLMGDLYVNCNANSTGGQKVIPIPEVSASDNGKILRVVNGAWRAVEIPTASGEGF